MLGLGIMTINSDFDDFHFRYLIHEPERLVNVNQHWRIFNRFPPLWCQDLVRLRAGVYA